jgi:hypothetical protein
MRNIWDIDGIRCAAFVVAIFAAVASVVLGLCYLANSLGIN